MTGGTKGRRVRAMILEDASTSLSQLVEVLHSGGDIVVVGQPATAADAIECVAQ